MKPDKAGIPRDVQSDHYAGNPEQGTLVSGAGML
jgi:hypothetical protein